MSFEGREQFAIWWLEGVSRAEMARRLGEVVAYDQPGVGAQSAVIGELPGDAVEEQMRGPGTDIRRLLSDDSDRRGGMSRVRAGLAARMGCVH